MIDKVAECRELYWQLFSATANLTFAKLNYNPTVCSWFKKELHGIKQLILRFPRAIREQAQQEFDTEMKGKFESEQRLKQQREDIERGAFAPPKREELSAGSSFYGATDAE